MKQLIYILIIILLASCEEIYRPNIDEVKDLLVVEAIIISNSDTNSVKLYQTHGFYDTDTYPAVHGANVYLSDDFGNKLPCNEDSEGIYNLSRKLEPFHKYKLTIELDGETYVSEEQEIPDIPVLDTVYGEYDFKVSIDGTATSSEKIERDYGFQLYSDFKDKGATNHYRFNGRKVVGHRDTVQARISQNIPWNFSLRITISISLIP